jgi:hypothetical protein
LTKAIILYKVYLNPNLYKILLFLKIEWPLLSFETAVGGATVLPRGYCSLPLFQMAVEANRRLRQQLHGYRHLKRHGMILQNLYWATYF